MDLILLVQSLNMDTTCIIATKTLYVRVYIYLAPSVFTVADPSIQTSPA